MAQLVLVQLPTRGNQIQEGAQWVPKQQRDHRNGFSLKIEPQYGDKWKFSFDSSDKLGLEYTSQKGFSRAAQAREAAEKAMVKQSNRIGRVVFNMQENPEHYIG